MPNLHVPSQRLERKSPVDPATAHILQGSILETSPKPDNLLTCNEWDNTVRWQQGERLNHLFEYRCHQFLFENNAQHLAVDSEKGQWSYQQLNNAANQLARYLLAQGLKSGAIIGLLFDKSAHSYIAMLAVLKINAAYVPLDPVFPKDRIAYIAEDSAMQALLTLSCYENLTHESKNLNVLSIDTKATAQAIAAQPDMHLLAQETGQPVSELCYIIYTSGSTGRPKGVPIDQASICNFVRVAAEVYGYSPNDRVYQGLTIAFDFAVEEIWVPLIVGATLLPNQTGSSLLGSDLAGFLQAKKATAMCCVPTLLATIDEDLPNLRLLIVSGEACPQDLINRWYTPERVILNAYGPTEITVTATLARSKPNEPVTIGKPLPTYSVIILQPNTQKVLPFGEVGEIAVAGVGVARGYLNQEEKTKEVFINDFLNIPNNPSGLIYRTGDLGLINREGEIEYRGRIDLQVKIRGYRIELTEIESVILQMPHIEQAVVDTFEPIPDVKELVAYYTLKEHADFSQEQLVTHLRETLPNYMVPSYYEKLDVMPMMASDKADRKALPKPSSKRMSSDNANFVAAQNTLEKNIAAVLAEMLQLDAVSAEDHFFDDLGANSLLMAQFSTRLRNKLGIVDLSMREMYLHPSVQQLATFLETLTGSPKKPLRKKKASYKAPRKNYILTGIAQVFTGFAMFYFGAFIFWLVFDWLIEAQGIQAAYGRALILTSGLFILSLTLPILLKWSLIGRFKPEEFPVWSWRYFTFWTVKIAMTISPMRAFVGTPIFTAYLKLLGAKVSWNSLILTNKIPVCVDMLTVGDGAVISKNVNMSGYRVDSGRLKTGKVTLGNNTFVGSASMMGLNTVMEDGSELAHASSLHSGQRLKANTSYHGSPAQPTTHHYQQLKNGKLSFIRKFLFSCYIVIPIFIFLPLGMVFLHYLFGTDIHGDFTPLEALLPITRPSDVNTIFIWTALLFSIAIPISLLLMTMLIRLLNFFIKEDKIYSVYSFHYLIQHRIQSLSNSRFYNNLFGDSSYIVYYLQAIGYKFKGIVQTGSNFGVSQKQDNPLLCEIGNNTMVSDGLNLLNTDYSISSFQVSKVSIGENTFIGNSIAYPPKSKVGNNCLLATKVMIPTHGALKEDVGLLGSPCFEIPRSVRRDSKLDDDKQEGNIQQRLKQKNKVNITTMILFLFTLYIPFFLGITALYFTLDLLVEYKALYFVGAGFIASLFIFPYFFFVERASLTFRHLKAEYCSIYDNAFWRYERYWKLSMISDRLLQALNGTPFKGMALRALGTRVGKQLFDDGGQYSERTLVEMGDHCTLNQNATLQAHSLEDGTFKSDKITVGNNCTLAKNTFIHYGVIIGNNVAVETDSFLMKGENLEANSIWHGNPAKEILIPAKACTETVVPISQVAKKHQHTSKRKVAS